MIGIQLISNNKTFFSCHFSISWNISLIILLKIIFDVSKVSEIVFNIVFAIISSCLRSVIIILIIISLGAVVECSSLDHIEVTWSKDLILFFNKNRIFASKKIISILFFFRSWISILNWLLWIWVSVVFISASSYSVSI